MISTFSGFVFAIVVGLVASYPRSIKNDVFQGPHVFLTINAEAGLGEDGSLQDRLVEVNWYNLDVTQGGRIGLFSEDPEQSPDEPAVQPVLTLNPTTSDGYAKTSSRFAPIDYTEMDLSTIECVGGWWVAFYQANEPNNRPTLKNCIRVNPHWMEDLKDVIGSKRLTDILIPGTHDAMSYKNYEGVQDELDITVVWAYNQADDMYSQLVHGVRFFDVRFGRFPEDPVELYWIVHGEIRTVAMSRILPQLRKFLSETEEIVIFDCHQADYGLATDEEHDGLINYLFEELGEFAFDNKGIENPTLDDIWTSGKRLWLTYAHGHIVDRYDFLRPNIRHVFGDKNNVDGLEQFITTAIPEAGCQGTFHSAMAEMTPTVADIILMSTFGLRGNAQLVNIPVSNWFRNPSLYDFTNVISTDFYLGNNIIEMAIAINKLGGNCRLVKA